MTALLSTTASVHDVPRMPVFEKRSILPVPRDALAAYHERPGAFERLIPPWTRVRLLQNAGPIVNGKRVVLQIKLGPIWKTIEAHHFDVAPGRRFRDRMKRGPFESWIHSHFFNEVKTQAGMPVPLKGVEAAADAHPVEQTFLPVSELANPVAQAFLPVSELVDHIDYEIPLGIAGRLVAGSFVRREIEAGFAFRHARTANDLRRHARFADRPRQVIAVTGASGAIASNLIPFLTTAGHEVYRLVRGRADADDQIAWNPSTGEVRGSTLEDCHTLIHLAGKNIATRWTRRNRRDIVESRVDATRKLCQTLARMRRPPNTLVCASAVGFYGDRGEALLDESSPRGSGFVAELCEQWERATDPAREAGIRVVNVRIGVAISGNSGAIKKLLPPARLGMIGRLGSGQQWMPWIAMDDLVAILDACVNDSSIEGVVNGVTGSVRQIEFTKTLAHVLKRPALAPLPAAGVKAIFGAMGNELLLASARVKPSRVWSEEFAPAFGTLEAALRFELGR